MLSFIRDISLYLNSSYNTPLMSEPTTLRYLSELEPHRDALFAKALAEAGDPIRAEGLLQGAVHATFEAYATGAAPKDKSLTEWFADTLVALKPNKIATPSAVPPEGSAMPAATWARLYGAVQLEAVRFGQGKGLNPDSVLLSPDPLLAPRKIVRTDDADALENHPARFFAFSAIAALVLGIALTVFISSRTEDLTVSETTTAPSPVSQPTPVSDTQPATQVMH